MRCGHKNIRKYLSNSVVKPFYKLILGGAIVSSLFAAVTPAQAVVIVDLSALVQMEVNTATGAVKTLFCNGKIPGQAKISSTTARFSTFAELLKIDKKKRKQNKKKIAQLADLNKRGKIVCSGGVLPTPTPRPDVTPTPRPTATPSSGGGNFDANGNVTAQGKTAFGIPSSLSGNVSVGQGVFSQNCQGCHSSNENVNKTFSQYKSIIGAAPMFINLSDSSLANLVAYMNRFKP